MMHLASRSPATVRRKRELSLYRLRGAALSQTNESLAAGMAEQRFSEACIFRTEAAIGPTPPAPNAISFMSHKRYLSCRSVMKDTLASAAFSRADVA
ncbi:hypothetical protein AB4156_25990 [Cupriavidus sp. 2MCAB6]|uniref:hypothetical protein n=1 Tax=Cupriavidus sp. 2MCAB6 TaxID=3232981 RepID=UPI003F92BCEC